jgi:hypothetical protein
MTVKRAVNESVDNLVNRLPEELIEAWTEKSSVLEFDAGYSRPHAEAQALLYLIENEPDVLTDLRAAQIEVENSSRFFVASSEELLREHADILGGVIAARRSVAWVLDEEYGGLAEFVAA